MSSENKETKYLTTDEIREIWEKNFKGWFMTTVATEAFGGTIYYKVHFHTHINIGDYSVSHSGNVIPEASGFYIYR